MTVSENSGAKAAGDIKMEGQSLIDDLVGWGPNSAEVLSGHPAAHPRNKSSLDQPIRRELRRLVQRAGTEYSTTCQAWQFSTRTAADRGVSTTVYLTGLTGLWRLVRVARGMALKRGYVLACAAVLEAVPGPWGSSQTLIKVLPGRSAARAGLGELTGRQAAASDTALIAVPPAETGLGDRDE